MAKSWREVAIYNRGFHSADLVGESSKGQSSLQLLGTRAPEYKDSPTSQNPLPHTPVLRNSPTSERW